MPQGRAHGHLSLHRNRQGRLRPSHGPFAAALTFNAACVYSRGKANLKQSFLPHPSHYRRARVMFGN
jgi:hypothetical protein